MSLGVPHAKSWASPALEPLAGHGRARTKVGVVGLALACALAFWVAPARADSLDAERQAIGQDLIQCAALRSYQKLCLAAEHEPGQADQMRGLDQSIQAFILSACNLWGDDGDVFKAYRKNLTALRKENEGRCESFSPPDQSKFQQCANYEQARTDPRNPWRN